MIKAPNGDILIDKKVTGIENLLDLIVDTTGLQKGDIRIDESTIREVSEKDRNTAVDVEITKGGHTNRVVAYYNRVSLTEVGTVEGESQNDWVLNYMDGQNGDFSTAFNDKSIKTKLKQQVADRINIPSDEIVVESIDYSNKQEGNTSITFKAVGDNAKTIKDKFTVKSWYIPPLYTINDTNFEKKLGTPYDFSTTVKITVKNDRDVVTDLSTHVADGHRHADNPLFFPKGHITDLESTNYEFGNTDDELVGFLVDAYHTGEIQDSVNNKYEVTELKQLENSFSKIWVENKNKDITDRNGYYKIKQFDPGLHVQKVEFINGTSESVIYVHGYSTILYEGYITFKGDDGKTYNISDIRGEGFFIYPEDYRPDPPSFINEDDLIYMNPNRGPYDPPPPPDYSPPELSDNQKREIEEYFERLRRTLPSFSNENILKGLESEGLFNLKYGQIFKPERIEDFTDEGGRSKPKAYGTAKIVQFKSNSSNSAIFDKTNKTYYSHSNYGKLYTHGDPIDLIYFAKMTVGKTPSEDEIREEKELIKREIFNRYGLPYDKISIDWDRVISSNFDSIPYTINSSVACVKGNIQDIKVYKRIVPKFGGSPVISADIRYLNRQMFKENVNMHVQRDWGERFKELTPDKNGVVDYYYFSKG